MAKMGPRKPKPVVERKRWNIVRGDKVQVIGDHPERGKQGTVAQVFRDRDRVLISGVNVGQKHLKGDPERGIAAKSIQRERTVPYSNVNLVDPVTGKPTRIIRTILDDGSKVRVAKKSGAVIPRPEILTVRKKPVSSVVTDSDTLEADVWTVTYQSAAGASPQIVN
jgi:large subunit ribosomal protein L24